MTDNTPNFDHILRLQAIAKNAGRDADVKYGTNPCSEIILRPNQFCNLSTVVVKADDDLETLTRKIEMAIKEIERLHRDYSCICGQMRRMMEERDEARRRACRDEALIRLERGRVHRDSEEVVRMAKEISVERGWDCFKENTDGK
jgi:hypothetical protein